MIKGNMQQVAKLAAASIHHKAQAYGTVSKRHWDFEPGLAVRSSRVSKPSRRSVG